MKNKGERGSFTIEATLALSIFMFAYVSILSLAMIAKVESTTQYAINQVAKEISQYCYVLDRSGIVDTSGEGVEKIDETIQAIVDFADVSTQTASKYSGTTANDISQMDFGDLSNDFSKIETAATKLYNSIGPILDDPKGVLSSLAGLFMDQAMIEIMGRVIAQPLCKALVPKYIVSNGDVDATLEKMGVVDGLDGLDFRLSSFLSDQRSINVVVVYQIKVNGFGIFDDTLVIKQTASTAAWVTGRSLKEVSEAAPKWSNSNQLERGKEYVAELKDEENLKAVKAGTGIDLYDQETNTYTSVKSMNVFSTSYSDYQQSIWDVDDADAYNLKKDKIKSTVKRYANDLNADIKDVGDSITLEDGTDCMTARESVMPRNAELILVVPEEAKSNPENLAILNEIAEEIQKETNVEVKITYREKALGG